VDGLEVGQLVVVGVDAGAEEEPRVSAVHDLVIAELDEIGLILLVAGRNEAVNFALELDLLLVAVGGVPFCESGFAPGGRPWSAGACWGLAEGGKGMERGQN
jgi:hypothetical protein